MEQPGPVEEPKHVAMDFDHERQVPEEDVMLPPFVFNPIGFMESPLRKNGSPRQGALAGNVRGRLTVSSGTGNNEFMALDGLESFSHVWLVFVFHRNRGAEKLRNKVQPPKVADKKGLFATRTPHRPNPIGLTLCRLDGIEGCTLLLSQHDLIDGTPVLDVKPYLPFSDSVDGAKMAPWVPIPAAIAAPDFDLSWSPEALKQLAAVQLRFYAASELDLFRETVRHLLSLNPRSKFWINAYGSYYYIRFDRLTLHFTFTGDASAVVDRLAERDDKDK